jgi:hypothetical protein
VDSLVHRQLIDRPEHSPMTSSIESTSSVNATPATAKVTVDDLGSEEAFLAAIDETIKYFNDGDIVAPVSSNPNG